MARAIVDLPDPIEELAGEWSNTGRRASKGWLKALTGVDCSVSDGFAFEGSFLSGARAELEVGTWVLGFGADRRRWTAVGLWQVTPDGLAEQRQWRGLKSPWALACRDEIAELVAQPPDRDALIAERATLVARLAEIDEALGGVDTGAEASTD